MEDRTQFKRSKAVDLEALSKDELLVKIRKLEKHVEQLKNVIAKHGQEGVRRVFTNDRKFDFKKYNSRHVALKILYLGWDYHGFVVQEDTNKTIELALFEALVRAKLIESRETSNYHRCGRTDKGVSAFSQVISIDVRSNLLEGDGVKIRENGLVGERGGDKTKELDYVHVLNSLLPEEIRVIAWAPVRDDFSARFNCTARTYKYFFPRGQLNIEAMRDVAARLVGHRDFRNLCKMDVQNGVLVYMRHLYRAEIEPVGRENNEAYDMFAVTIAGNAFLWHQIRCIMAVLLLVGEGKEKPSVIDDLLDIETNPKKPQYALASELPLVLFECTYEDVEWNYDDEDMIDLVKHMQAQWTKHSLRATMTRQMLQVLEGKADAIRGEDCHVTSQADSLLVENKCRVYKRLMERNKCESLEERIVYYAKRRKIDSCLESVTSDVDAPMTVSESSS